KFGFHHLQQSLHLLIRHDAESSLARPRKRGSQGTPGLESARGVAGGSILVTPKGARFARLDSVSHWQRREKLTNTPPWPISPHFLKHLFRRTKSKSFCWRTSTRAPTNCFVVKGSSSRFVPGR